MTLAFLNLGVPEILILLLVLLLFHFVVADYGKSTILGYWGSLMLSIFLSPFAAIVIIWIMKARKTE